MVLCGLALSWDLSDFFPMIKLEVSGLGNITDACFDSIISEQTESRILYPAKAMLYMQARNTYDFKSFVLSLSPYIYVYIVLFLSLYLSIVAQADL